ncbi:hypothetical protein ACFOZ0_27350 [Streptomyces yaanensis]|uniref:Uncharacterized protein n=1 Tax=Streptomyces yaanensis TaxID=1142239 RepID=A0ABV7SKC1_9ACTN|nr:hypothetical protein [Streptomyces sp. CGMCC 4.7035]WNB97061.1 hypothetical protein Q2K21_02665 [Streptomyces sp. CGMCC 4.7035]
MNGRVLRIELRRSVAPWAGVVVLAAALAFLYLIPGPWWNGTASWTAQWTSMAMWTRALLIYLWPLALGLGALQGLRDHRSNISELLTSTPRPARHRAATLAGTTALTLASAFALLVLVGGVQVLADTEYTHLRWLPISLVGALSLVAGAVLGMGLGRALPSPLTPPVLAVAAFVFTNLLQASQGLAAVPEAAVPNRISLLSPAVGEAREVLLTLSTSVHLGQTIWLLGMAATGFALLAAATPRARLLALTPVLAGAALALLVLPSDARRTYVVDEAAAAMVCDGPVCVSKAHQARLADLAGPGKKALRLLHDALGSQAPTSIRESTALRALMDTPERSRTAVLLDFDDGMIADAKGEELTRALVAQGMAPICFPRSDNESGTAGEIAAQSVAAGWVLGDLKPLGGTIHSSRDQLELARPVWKKLKALQWSGQLSRINAMHAGAVSCKGDPLTVLDGGASR